MLKKKPITMINLIGSTGERKDPLTLNEQL